MKKISNFLFIGIFGFLVFNFFFKNQAEADAKKSYESYQSGNAIFVDVREESEVKEGMIKGAHWNIQHISAYCLTIEERTPLATWVKKGSIHPVDADLQSDQFERLVAILSTYGFEQYEISNFARNKAYSKHNSSYWKGKSYLGIGPSSPCMNGSAMQRQRN
jgi:coproporphyrinogen III oxidase-like Fe-S oxidoreductase